MKTERTCFVCMENARNRFCSVCKCYAHVACSKKYLRANIGKNRCPQCRSHRTTKVLRYTRARVMFGRAIFERMTRMFDQNRVTSFRHQCLIAENIALLILANKKLMKLPGFTQLKKAWVKHLNGFITRGANLEKYRKLIVGMI